MGIIMPPTRALSQQVFFRASTSCTRLSGTCLRRVNPICRTDNHYSTTSQRKPTDPRVILSQVRLYATETATATAKTPKASTGRKRSTTAKKPAAAKGKGKAKAKKGPKAKPKAKPQPRKRVLTEKQKEAKAKLAASQKVKDLRTKALLNHPKRLPQTAWTVLVASETPDHKGSNAIVSSKAAATNYRNMSPEEHVRLNHTANENKAKNEAARQKWLASFTPAQIKDANNARLNLRRRAKKDGSKKMYPLLQDDRLVKRPFTAYTHFFVERNASGDMHGMKVGEIGTLLGKEWSGLSASERKPYEDKAANDKKRYIAEYTSAYGSAPPATVTKKPKA